MVGGLLVSQLLTLFITPVIYLYLEQARRFFSGHTAAEPTAPARDRRVVLPGE